MSTIVRELLPELVNQIIYLMAGDEPEQQEVIDAVLPFSSSLSSF